MTSVSLIIPTIGRPSLARTLASIRGQDWQPGDEILLVGDGKQPAARRLWEQMRLPGRYIEVEGPNGDWGHTPRNIVMSQVNGDYIAALDDDDEWTPGALAAIRAALCEDPGCPHMFRMDATRVPITEAVLWREPSIEFGNIGTPMFVVPTAGGLWGRYTPRIGGDFDFIRSTLALWPSEALVWREEVICTVRPYCPAK